MTKLRARARPPLEGLRLTIIEEADRAPPRREALGAAEATAPRTGAPRREAMELAAAVEDRLATRLLSLFYDDQALLGAGRAEPLGGA